jgi:hypothetical protein
MASRGPILNPKPARPSILHTGVTVICYIDAFSGLAGDMLVAALADAGAERDAITRALQSLSTEGAFAWGLRQKPGCELVLITL